MIQYLLFDFFGTLVDYSPSRTAQGHEGSHRLLRRLGARLSYDDFLTTWSRVSAEFDRRSDLDDREFSMSDVGAAFLTGALGREPATADVEAFVAQYLSEWNTGVRHLPGLDLLLSELGRDHRLAVVTNTHDTFLVPGHLAAMGVRSRFDAVIASVEVGRRKPHPEIYATALKVWGADASSAVFVGDTYGPDFLGPEQVGIKAFLIDPHRRAPIPDDRRLTSIFDLPSRLRHRDAPEPA